MFVNTKRKSKQIEEMKSEAIIIPLERKDLKDFVKLSNKTLGTTHSLETYINDYETNSFSQYYKLIFKKKMLGLLSIWLVFDDIQIISIAIDSDYQGNGYGNQLMTFLFELVKKHDIKTITLEVRISNQRAIKFYNKFGFNAETVRKRYYNDGEDAYLMVKTF